MRAGSLIKGRGGMPCIVVKRGEFASYDHLYQAYGKRLPVVWDRRRTRQVARESHPPAKERRSPAVPISWTFLSFVVAQDSTR
jgi:hypothetical protein